MQEGVDEDYLNYRLTSTRYVGRAPARRRSTDPVAPGRPRDLPRRQALRCRTSSRRSCPGVSVAIALYLLGGVRACEIGTLMFGQRDPETGEELAGPRELVRLAIPRRVYTQSHMDYVIEVVIKAFEQRASCRPTASSSSRRSCGTSRRSWSRLG